jgi:hypothetical protein
MGLTKKQVEASPYSGVGDMQAQEDIDPRGIRVTNGPMR